MFAMETTSRSECYTRVSFPPKVALVLGNEVIGVDTAVLALCDKIIEIPTFGQVRRRARLDRSQRETLMCVDRLTIHLLPPRNVCPQKNSLNVASAAPVVVFEVLRQWGALDRASEAAAREKGEGGEGK